MRVFQIDFKEIKFTNKEDKHLREELSVDWNIYFGMFVV